VVCYTNAPSARLTLNGQPYGGDFISDPQTGVLYQDVEYQQGVLRCEAANGAAYEIKTTGQPVALRLTTDSVAHVFVEVVDADGNVVKTADQEVTLTVRGARFLGMENGDIMDASVTGRQAKNRLRVRGGRRVGYFQLPESANEVTIQASSSFLQSAEIKL
jgi:hypothetical protein